MTHQFKTARRRFGLVVIPLAATLAFAACSSSKSSGSGSSVASAGSSLPSTIGVLSTTDLTGAAAFAGKDQLAGIQLATEQINDQKFLGSSTIKLTSKDTASTPATATSVLSQAVADTSISAVVGTVLSQESVAVAPIVQAGKLPTVFTQSGSDGVVVGNYTFRATPPQSSYFDLEGAYLQKKDVKTLAIIDTSDNPTIQDLMKTAIPAAAQKYGFKVTNTAGVLSSTQDLTAPIAKVTSGNPDAVLIAMYGAQIPTAATQLTQAGYRGVRISNLSAGGGVLKPAGSAGAGIVWSTDFSPLQTAPSTQTFVEAYQAKYNTAPSGFAAEGFDAMWMIARAIKAEGSATRAGIQQGLDKIAAQGFTGALGTVTFDNRDERAPGVLIAWDGTKETLAGP